MVILPLVINEIEIPHGMHILACVAYKKQKQKIRNEREVNKISMKREE